MKMTDEPPETGDARTDNDMASIVERGIEFYKTLGKTVAIAYFREQHVPEPVARRIFDSTQGRRALRTAAPPRYYG